MALGSVLGFGKGFVQGVGEGGKALAEGAWDLAKGGYHLATDPAAREQAWQAAREVAQTTKDYYSSASADQIIADTKETWSVARDSANRLYSAFDKARQEAASRGESSEFYGKIVGRGGFEVAALFVPAGAAAKVAEGARAEKVAASALKAANAAEEILPCGKVVPSHLPLASKSVLEEVRRAPKLKKPSPEAYLSEEYIRDHLAAFDSGAVKIISSKPNGPIGKSEGMFVLPKSDAEHFIRMAEGDPRKLEKLLELPENYLGDKPYIVEFKDVKVKMPTGNEPNAMEGRWLPGGYTGGGTKEAVMHDVIPEGNYTSRQVFGDRK